MALPDAFLPALVARLDDPNVVGILLTGSYARGVAGPYSDVDLNVYVRVLPEQIYQLQEWGDHLVSLTFSTLEAEQAKLTRPQAALWVVPGLRQAVILLDSNGDLKNLKQSALDFNPQALQPLADQYAIEELAGFAEEARKILNGLQRGDESTVLYAVMGMQIGLARAVAAQRGLLVNTENEFLDLLQDSVGRGSLWTRAFRLALGADLPPGPLPPYQGRGQAALALYRETASLFKNLPANEDRDVIQSALGLIQNSGY